MPAPDPRTRLAELDAVLAALAHPARRQVLLVVRFRGGAMTAGEIAERFHHAWPTTSRHLRVLEAAGLLTHRKRGRIRLYEVNSAKLAVVREWLQWFDDNGPAVGDGTGGHKKGKTRPPNSRRHK